MKLIYIEWEDATSAGEWIHEDDIKAWCKEEHNIIKQVGWVIEENKKRIVVFSRFTHWKKYQDEYGMVQKIPRTWIKKYINLTKYIK